MSTSIDADTLKRQIGTYLGFKRDISVWSSDQAQDVDDIILSGKRQLAFPPVLPGEKIVHQWSWLRTSLTINTVADQVEYVLPLDFGGLDGPMIVSGDGMYECRRIQIQPLHTVEHCLLTKYDYNTFPLYAAIEPYTDPAAPLEQKWKLFVAPSPDRVYDIEFNYHVAAEQSNFGGAPHAETLLASCISIAERTLNDESGEKYEYFLERLKSSIAIDRRNMSPDRLGRAKDTRLDDGYRSGYNQSDHYQGDVTVVNPMIKPV